ncbi:MAG: hypothetical protein WD036_07655 [Bauldia sp.]
MRNRRPYPSAIQPDQSAAGFVVWIVVYATFMLALFALRGGVGAMSIH